MVPYQWLSKQSICSKYFRVLLYQNESTFSLLNLLEVFFFPIFFQPKNWTIMASQLLYSFYGAMGCSFKQKPVLIRTLSAKCVIASCRWLRKLPSTIPEERPQGLPLSYCLSDSIISWVSASNLTKSKRQPKHWKRIVHSSPVKQGMVSTKNSNVLHMAQLLGRRINHFHACSGIRNKEKFLKISRTRKQFVTNQWKGKLPSAQGQHFSHTLDSGSGGAILKLWKM